jgi:hypothetical protein
VEIIEVKSSIMTTAAAAAAATGNLTQMSFK